MHIHIVPNRRASPTVLLRESYRDGTYVRKRTLANLSSLPASQIELIRRVLKGETLAGLDDIFEIVPGGSRLHGHVHAVLTAMKRLGFASLIGSRPSRQRNLVVAMVASYILRSQSKLATTRWWHTTTLPEMLGVTDADEDELYDAMDWLLARQGGIEKKLADRHLAGDAMALYDLSSSYFEGVTCPLAALGHNRDGKKGKLQVNYGLLTNRHGIPVSVSVFKGNTGDPKTLLPQVEKVRDVFGIERFVMVGDRGMITQTQIEMLRDLEGIDWIGALRPEAIRKLVETGAVQMGLFDERNLFEITHSEFPGERLVACRNPELAKSRAHTRHALIEATAGELDTVTAMVGRGRLTGTEAIGARVGKVLDGYTIGRHYTVELNDDAFAVTVDEHEVLADAIGDLEATSERAAKRVARCRTHMDAIAAKLDRVREAVAHGRLHGKDAIGMRVGRVINKYKVAKHFTLVIGENGFDYEIDQSKVASEAALDGIYVIRTSLPDQRMTAEQVVLSYKLLSQNERAFRSMKTVDLNVRPIRHRREHRVRAHIFLCMLAYYVQWHLIEAWRPLLFCDEDTAAKARRDPVAPATRSPAALAKAHTKRLADGSEVHSVRTLLECLGGIVRNRCRRTGATEQESTFDMETAPDATQRRAYELLEAISV
ncbi:MAG: transposase [Acidobacteria bacterium]|nr:transposase [Acidobacteriota bacterium]